MERQHINSKIFHISDEKFLKMSKSGLAIVLSKLKVFESPNVNEEQYSMDSEIGAEILWTAALMGDIEGKVIADLGCGTGILGIGALLLGSEKVFFVDKDEKVLKILEQNLKSVSELAKSESSFADQAEIEHKSIKDFNQKSDIVIQNPPFGVKNKGADKEFLEVAFKTADVVYSFHKFNCRDFIEQYAESQGFKTTHLWKFDFPIKATQAFHKRKIYRFEVGCWRFERR